MIMPSLYRPAATARKGPGSYFVSPEGTARKGPGSYFVSPEGAARRGSSSDVMDPEGAARRGPSSDVMDREGTARKGPGSYFVCPRGRLSGLLHIFQFSFFIFQFASASRRAKTSECGILVGFCLILHRSLFPLLLHAASPVGLPGTPRGSGLPEGLAGGATPRPGTPKAQRGKTRNSELIYSHTPGMAVPQSGHLPPGVRWLSRM